MPGIGRVDANDLDPSVVEAMKRNVEFNGPEAVARVNPLQGDCRVAMMQVPYSLFLMPLVMMLVRLDHLR